MMPEAPVRFSTMKFCLSESVSLAASRRASGSTEPPGGYGETNLTGLTGHSCAIARFVVTKKITPMKNLEGDIPSPFQLEHLARLVRGRYRKAQLLQNPLRLADLVGVGLRQLAAADPQAVLQADADVAAHHRGLRCDPHLRAP